MTTLGPSTFVGVDVGLSGGIAAIVEGAPMPIIFDMPTDVVVGGTRAKPKNKHVVNGQRLRKIFAEIQSMSREMLVLIERPQLRPAMRDSGHDCPTCGERHMVVNQGIASQAGFLEQYGLIRGVLVGLAIPYEDIHPATWKADIFHGASDKTDARAKAAALFPLCAERFRLVKNDGLAEAILIAEYNRRHAGAPF